MDLSFLCTTSSLLIMLCDLKSSCFLALTGHPVCYPGNFAGLSTKPYKGVPQGCAACLLLFSEYEAVSRRQKGEQRAQVSFCTLKKCEGPGEISYHVMVSKKPLVQITMCSYRQSMIVRINITPSLGLVFSQCSHKGHSDLE